MPRDDRNWMRLERVTAEWQTGFKKFIDSTFGGTSKGGTAPCPCTRCRCMAYRSENEVTKHLIWRGFSESFIQGEGEGKYSDEGSTENDGTIDDEVRKELYPGCKEATKDAANYKMAEKECESDKMFLSTEEEDMIFQSSYKESTGCKTSKVHGYGYITKLITRDPQRHAQYNEQARATTASNKKILKLEVELQNLKDKLANEVAERERIMQQFQEFKEEESKKTEEIKKSIIAELLSKFAEHREVTLTQTDPKTIFPSECVPTLDVKTVEDKVQKNRNSNVSRNLSQNSEATVIAPQHLITPVAKRVRTWRQQENASSIDY